MMDVGRSVTPAQSAMYVRRGRDVVTAISAGAARVMEPELEIFARWTLNLTVVFGGRLCSARIASQLDIVVTPSTAKIGRAHV